MLQQIVAHTPLYVWAILALLIQRGISASRDRDISVQKLCILPIAMAALSLQGIHHNFGLDGVAPMLWLAGAAGGAVLGWRLNQPARLAVYPAHGIVRQPGSWLPLVLMLSIFCMKFAVATTLSMMPALRHDATFMVTVCALYGMFNGILGGSLLRTLSAYFQTRHGAGRPVHGA